MKETFIRLVEENSGILFKVCRMYCQNVADREDLHQDMVLQLWRAYPSFKGESKVSTWIYRIALNTAIMRLRKESKKEKSLSLTEEAFRIQTETDSDQEDKLQLLAQAIEQLSEIEKAIMILYVEAHSYKEMAEIMGISESNVGIKLNRIKAKLKSRVNTLTHGTR